MEDGNTPTRDQLRDILSPAFDAAIDYCNDRAPIEYDGCLFINGNERPVEADDEAISNGAATALSIRDFTGLPIVGK